MNPIDSLGVVRGVLTAVLFAAFLTLWLWAWSSKRRTEFAAAAALALEEDATPVSRGESR
jgi:cytochrome c oxidase cbb3-type subunit IV